MDLFCGYFPVNPPGNSKDC